MRTSTAIAAFLLAGVAWSGAIAVEKPAYNPDRAVEQGPFLDPRTGSYFELRINRVNHGYWGYAKKQASSRSYKGRRGRLAVIKDAETLEFLREHFRVNRPTWIGLMFYCKYRKLMWVTGEIQPLHVPGLWAPRWYRNPQIRCTTERISSMPVFLTPEEHGPVFLQASGPSKSFHSFMIEYPAPPSEAKTQDGDAGEAAPVMQDSEMQDSEATSEAQESAR